jgi:hypothetical protein
VRDHLTRHDVHPERPSAARHHSMVTTKYPHPAGEGTGPLSLRLLVFDRGAVRRVH